MPNRLTQLGDEPFDDYKRERRFTEQNDARRALERLTVTPGLLPEMSAEDKDKLAALKNAGLILCNAIDVNKVSEMLGKLGVDDVKIRASAHLDPGRVLTIDKEFLEDYRIGMTIGKCKACERSAPLIDGECPNCRH